MKINNVNRLSPSAVQRDFNSLERSDKGFALIATISVMVLLVLIALAMLSLSTIELRTSGSGRDNEIARANARVSLMIAIGRLQETAGADTRITASADAVAGLSGGTRQLTGVWRSWEGLNHNPTTGQPITPDYGSKLDQGDPDDSSDEGRFLTWLVSSAGEGEITDIPDLISPADGVDRVNLLGSQTSATFDKVIVDTTMMTDGDDEVTGSYAWWIQGNNSKALIRHDDKDAPQTPEEWSNRLASYSFSDSEHFDIPDNEDLDKGTATFNTLSLARDNITPVQHVEDFHDLTTIATGLLTNASTGGWKRDLSLFSEKYTDSERAPWGQELPTSQLSTFNLQTDQINRTGLVSSGDGYLYPWVSEDNICMTWASLADFASLYKKVQVESSSSSGGAPYFNITSSATSVSSDRNLQSHDQFTIVEPILSRTQFILGYSSLNTGRKTGTGLDIYRPVLAVKPIVAYFNPYNVSTDSSTFIVDGMVLSGASDSGITNQTWPIKFGFTHTPSVGGEIRYDVVRTTQFLGARNNAGMLLQPWFNRLSKVARFGSFEDINFRWKPGESKVLGVSEREVESLNVPLTTNNNVTRLMTGFDTNAAYSLFIDSSVGSSWSIQEMRSNKPTFTERDTMTVDVSYSSSGTMILPAKFDRRLEDSGREPNLIPEAKEITTIYNGSTINQTLPLPSDLRESSPLDQIVFPIFEPFLSFSFGLRSLADTSVKTKGYVSHKQIVPLNFTAANIADTDISHSVFDWIVKPLSSSADPANFSDEPGFSSDRDTSAYIGTSERPDLGVNRWAIAELPTQPLLSLCELQHFDPAFLNYHYPLVANAIGNSHASPFIAANATRVNGTNGLDHSYIANHLLWDDWFISSLAPETRDYRVVEDLDTVFTDTFSGTTDLRNQAYRPQQILSETEAQSKMMEYKEDGTSWEKVASELVIDGMFNVNSTSVPAWTALLSSQLKNNPVFQEVIAQMNATIPTMEALGDELASVSRFTINSDKDSTNGGAQNSVTAPQEWTKDMFEDLAERIVAQIRLRGPFLSLSEFMNRQLSSNQDLAIAGTVEAALLEYANEGSSTPYDEILNTYSGPGFQAQAHDTYEFPEAGEGHVYYGVPGWARQADILRPIASVLSARDDTFTIRAYGDARDATGKIIARAWCEAIVSRGADFVDATDEASAAINEISETNRKNGRRFRIVSFRWLSPEEV